jgi:hypothetical protein
MIVYVLTRITSEEAGLALTTRAYRDQWSAIHAAEQESGSTDLVWSPPPDADAAHWEAGDYLLDELVVEPRAVGPRCTKLTVEVDAGPNAQAVQFSANGIALGAPDAARPFRKNWTRAEGQAEPVEITAEVTYSAGETPYKGVVVTVD